MSVQLLSTLPVDTMDWVYLAASLVGVLFVLLIAPYFGLYGDRDITEVEPSREDK